MTQAELSQVAESQGIDWWPQLEASEGKDGFPDTLHGDNVSADTI